jgi:serine/threonine-protein kinase
MAYLSDSYRLMGTFGMAPFDEVMPKARQVAERALAIDPSQAEAWATIACVAEQFEWEFERAQTIWERALALDPRHARGRAQRALWAFCIGTMTADRALAESTRAVQDDPLNSWVGAMHSHMLGFLGRHEESITEAERSVTLDPEAFFAHWNLMRSLAWAGRTERAIQIAPTILVASGRNSWVLGTLAWCYGKAGSFDRAGGVFAEMEGRSRHEFLSPYWLAIAAASAKLEDRAMELVERAVSEHDPLLLWARATPFGDGLRADRRFEHALRPVPAAVSAS